LVWSAQQKIAYVEYILKGGFSGRDIFFNYPNWGAFTRPKGDVPAIMELVDGKQRLTSIIGFLKNEFPVFGHYRDDYTDHLPDKGLRFNINNLEWRKDVVEWYIGMNTGGSIHTDEDLAPAYELLKSLTLSA
jgi:uncharacterized protein with ParB-like and HNH nuclease domain